MLEARRALLRSTDRHSATCLLRMPTLEHLAQLLGVPLRAILTHFPTRAGFLFAIYDRRDIRWDRFVASALEEHGTVEGLAQVLRTSDRQMPLLEFSGADIPLSSAQSDSFARLLRRSSVQFRRDVLVSMGREQSTKITVNQVSAIVGLFLTLKMDAGNDQLGEVTVRIWHQEASRISQSWSSSVPSSPVFAVHE